MKKLTAILTGLCLLLTLAACNAQAEKGTIFRFVENHQAELEQAIASGTIDEWEGTGVIEGVSANQERTEFSCGASGFGSETFYWGFFYSPENDPFALWAGVESDGFEPEGDGFLWVQPDGDNTCYVEHICGYFYYYEESY